MYNPDKAKLKKYVLKSGGSENMDWHAWLRDLTEDEKKHLRSEVLAAGSRYELSDYARQFYLHFCTDTEDARLRSIEHDFVMAQIEERAAEEVAGYEDSYFERAKELMRLKEKPGNESQ